MLQQKPGRILRPSQHWENNLDWTTDDTLQLTLGEHDVQWELKGSDVADMSIDDIKPPWKVHAPAFLEEQLPYRVLKLILSAKVNHGRFIAIEL